MKLNIQNFTGLVDSLEPNIANGFRYINFIDLFTNQNEQRTEFFLIKLEHNLYPYTDQIKYASMGIAVQENNDNLVTISDATQQRYGIHNTYSWLHQLSSADVSIELYQKYVNQLTVNNPYALTVVNDGHIMLSTANDQLSIINGINYLLNLRALLFSSMIQKQPKGAS